MPSRKAPNSARRSLRVTGADASPPSAALVKPRQTERVTPCISVTTRARCRRRLASSRSFALRHAAAGCSRVRAGGNPAVLLEETAEMRLIGVAKPIGNVDGPMPGAQEARGAFEPPQRLKTDGRLADVTRELPQ